MTIVSAQSITSLDLKLPERDGAERGSTSDVRAIVEGVIADIRDRGDDAVREYSEKFDDYAPESFLLTEEQLDEIVARVPEQVLDDIRFVQQQVRHYGAEAARIDERLRDRDAAGGAPRPEERPDRGRRRLHPGRQVPAARQRTHDDRHRQGRRREARGRRAHRSSRARCPTRRSPPCTSPAPTRSTCSAASRPSPPWRSAPRPSPRSNMLAGPGNAFVAEAKRQLFGEVGIDLFAGPTEVLIVADEHADPFIVAVDLLSQAEHGPDSPAILITTSEELGATVIDHIDELLPGMPTRDYAEVALARLGRGARRGLPRRRLRARRRVRLRARPDPHRRAPRSAREDAPLRRAVPRRGHLRLVRRQGDRHQPRAAHPWRRPLHRRPLGRQVPAHRHLPGGRNEESSAFLGELCGRAARVERFEGHARSGDVRAAKYAGAELPWSDHQFSQ